MRVKQEGYAPPPDSAAPSDFAEVVATAEKRCYSVFVPHDVVAEVMPNVFLEREDYEMFHTVSRCLTISTGFLLFALGAAWSGTEESRAAVIPVTPANVQKAIDALPEDTPASQKPDSLQAIVADSDTYAGDEDAIEFAPGTYDDIGELYLTRPITLRKDPEAEGDAVITGELLIQIKSKEVKVEGLTFRDVELGEVTILSDGETGGGVRFGSNPDHPRTGPVRYYFGDVTIQSFLLDRKAKVAAYVAGGGSTANCPATLPDCGHDYSSYTGQLHRTELGKHLIPGHARRWEFDPGRVISVRESGIPINHRNTVSEFITVGTNADRWDIKKPGIHKQQTIRGQFGHIMINPIRTDFGQTLANLPMWDTFGNDPDFSCPASEAFTGIEITRNTFDGTEAHAIASPEGNDIWRRAGRDCTVDVEIVGNTFRNVGVADDNFLTARDANGLPRVDDEGDPVFLTDGDGTRITRNNAPGYAISLAGPYRKVTISDNTINGGIYGPVRIDSLNTRGVHRQPLDPAEDRVDFRGGWTGFSADAEFVISNNLITGYNEEGSRGAELIDINIANEDTGITISRNRILAGSGSGPRYIVSPYSAANERLRSWCGANNSTYGGVTDSSTTFAQLDRAVKPVIAQSYVPDFPYPPLDGSRNVVDDDEGTREGVRLPLPAPIVTLFRPNEQIGVGEAFSNSDLVDSKIMIGPHDIVRATSCVRKAAIHMVTHTNTKISVVDNDLGYGGEGEESFYDLIALYTPAGALPRFERFSGNNIGYYERSLIGGTVVQPGFRDQGTTYRLATGGNYFEGEQPILTWPYNIDADREGELSEPIVRGEGDVGPRSGMTVEDPPAVPGIEGASFGASGRNVIVITYNTALDEDSQPPAGAFTVSWTVPGGRTQLTPTGVEVRGRTVTLTLPEPVPASVTSGVTVAYAAPDGAAALRTAQGELVAGGSRNVPAAEPVVPPPPLPAALAPGDGGCVLASAGSAGADMGMLLPFMLAGLAFVLRRKARVG